MILNIGRQLGSGGREIAKRIAQDLNMKYLDKELILLAAKESGIASEMFEKADECTQLTGGFWGFHLPWLSSLPFSSGLTNDCLFQIQSEVITKEATQHDCVFVGRCADYILRQRKDCLNVFISADENDRIQRLQAHLNIKEDEARNLIEKIDKQRAAYYNFYTNKTWGDAASYHLCLNSSVLGIDKSCEIIKQFITQWKE